MADKAMKIPGPDHPISIEANPSRIVVKVGTVKHRDQIAQLMAPSQIEQAQRLSSEKMYALIRCRIVPTLPCHWW